MNRGGGMAVEVKELGEEVVIPNQSGVHTVQAMEMEQEMVGTFQRGVAKWTTKGGSHVAEGDREADRMTNSTLREVSNVFSAGIPCGMVGAMRIQRRRRNREG